ncbi:hypothetical protein GCM10029964_092080 [Kibdelosporangium lantanae]
MLNSFPVRERHHLIDPVEGTGLVLRPADGRGSPDDDPRQMLVVTAAVAELLALTSSSPAATVAGLLAWIIRVLLELRA